MGGKPRQRDGHSARTSAGGLPLASSSQKTRFLRPVTHSSHRMTGLVHRSTLQASQRPPPSWRGRSSNLRKPGEENRGHKKRDTKRETQKETERKQPARPSRVSSETSSMQNKTETKKADNGRYGSNEQKNQHHNTTPKSHAFFVLDRLSAREREKRRQQTSFLQHLFLQLREIKGKSSPTKQKKRQKKHRPFIIHGVNGRTYHPHTYRRHFLAGKLTGKRSRRHS